MSSIGINRIYGNWPLPYLKNLKLNDNPNFVHESFGIFHPVFFPRLTQLNTQNTSMDGNIWILAASMDVVLFMYDSMFEL